MSFSKHKHKPNLYRKYPPSPPCSCDVCLSYCVRPGWWTVAEASRAIRAGYGDRIMLEVAPEFTFGVLSPAFKGCEAQFALNEFAQNGCTFLVNNRCELHGTGYQPLECRYCHHNRPGQGLQCHADLEADWRTPAGQKLVKQWCENNQIMRNYHFIMLRWP